MHTMLMGPTAAARESPMSRPRKKKLRSIFFLLHVIPVGMGLAPIRFPITRLVGWMGASPIPTDELQKIFPQKVARPAEGVWRLTTGGRLFRITVVGLCWLPRRHTKRTRPVTRLVCLLVLHQHETILCTCAHRHIFLGFPIFTYVSVPPSIT